MWQSHCPIVPFVTNTLSFCHIWDRFSSYSCVQMSLLWQKHCLLCHWCDKVQCILCHCCDKIKQPYSFLGGSSFLLEAKFQSLSLSEKGVTLYFVTYVTKSLSYCPLCDKNTVLLSHMRQVFAIFLCPDVTVVTKTLSFMSLLWQSTMYFMSLLRQNQTTIFFFRGI